METINNMAATAAKVVWGENKPTTAEPVSGRVGDTSKGEPYDAGNMEPISATTGEEATPVAIRPKSDVDTPSETSATVPKDKGVDDKVEEKVEEDASFAKNTGTATESKVDESNPSNELKTETGPDDTSKGQGDTRSPDDPKTNPKSAPNDVNDADEEGINKPQDVDGPGPKPLVEVAKEHGGDAGNSETSVDKEKSGDENGDDEAHKSAGTGEEYVKSSGLQADGGDFDATNPGAGREADRLLEEKGIHTGPTGPNEPDHGTADDGGSPTSGKKSFGQKIKDKLHRH